MSGRVSLPFSLQVLLWIAANSLAGAAVGVAVGFFRGGGLEAPVILMSVLFGNVVGLTVLVSSVVLFPRLRRFAPLSRTALLVLSLLSGAAAGTGLVLYLFPLYILRDVRQAMGVVAINATLALIVGAVVYAYEGLRLELAESLREIEEVRLVEARLEEQAARAELAALQARINPHFFFNTLNTISSLLEEDPAKAGEMVQALADLFRYTFKVAGAGPVPLREELRFIEGYLGIEQGRFGTRLTVRWEVDPEALDARIPGLVLQPLVENAVGHGIAPSARGGFVRIAAALADDVVKIEVEDDGVGLREDPDGPFREGHGLDNVRQRLETLYSGRAAVSVRPASTGTGTLVSLTIPTAAGPGGSPRAATPGDSAEARA